MRALALVPFYAGVRISEIVALDVDDVARSARKGVLRILGKGERVRHVPIHPQLRAALAGWLDERNDWPGSKDTPALFLNQRGQRLSVRGAHDIITAIAKAAGLDDHATVHVYADILVTPTQGSDVLCWWGDRRAEVGIIRRLNRGVGFGRRVDLDNGRRPRIPKKTRRRRCQALRVHARDALVVHPQGPRIMPTSHAPKRRVGRQNAGHSN